MCSFVKHCYCYHENLRLIGNENFDIGKGLFSAIQYKMRDKIAVFIGTFMSLNEYNNLKATREMHYGILYKNGWVLDCYLNATAASDDCCLASMAN